jgi:hypothetical protein
VEILASISEERARSHSSKESVHSAGLLLGVEWKKLLDGTAKHGFQHEAADNVPDRDVNKFSGFSWVDKPSAEKKHKLAANPEELSSESFLPWMPRPATHVCRSYGHIFRMLKDPGVTTDVQSRRPQQKKSLYVSVPRMPAVRPATGSSGDGGDMFEEVPATSALGGLAGKGSKSGSKSAPSLMNTSGFSTTADTWRSGHDGTSVSVEESTAYNSFNESFFGDDSRSQFSSQFSSKSFSLPQVGPPSKEDWRSTLPRGQHRRQIPAMSKTATVASSSFASRRAKDLRSA